MNTALAWLTAIAHGIGWLVVGVLLLCAGIFVGFWLTDKIGLTKMFDD